MSKIAPCLWFDGKAEDAAKFWTSLFPNSALGAVQRGPLVEFTLGGRRFQALDGGPEFQPNPSISFFAHVDEVDEATRLFDALSKDGKVMMPLEAYAWSPRYAWVQDRFGFSWQITTGRRPSPGVTIVPCLMFAGAQHGRANEAIERYTKLFPSSRALSVARYEPGEGPTGSVKHGLFELAGELFVAMDSHVSHDITFNEAISLSVDCVDQAEVDRLWNTLLEGGAPSQCGWLKDRFGVSWQIVPRRMVELQKTGDQAARDRTFKAMMKMVKLDVAALERAHRGET